MRRHSSVGMFLGALTFFGILLGVRLLANGADGPEPLSLYVSPDGSDQFTGTHAHNNQQRTDGPFATVGHARDVVRLMKQNNGGKLARPVKIILRGGTYWLTQPFELTADDSGTADCPITYCAYGNETPVLSAGVPVRGWDTGTVNGRQVWVTKLPQFASADAAFDELWFNGSRRHMARSPNRGYFKVAAPGPKDVSAFHYADGDLAYLADARQARVIVMTLWTESHLPIESIDEKNHLIQFTKSAAHPPVKDDRYFVEGAPELLDEPGEWYFDQKTATLSYLPKPGEKMLGSEVVVPWHQQVMRLVGSPDSGKFVEHVTFRGLTFANSEWRIPSGNAKIPGLRGGGFNQAAVGVPGAVWGAGVQNCLFDHCTVTHCGNYGIELAGGCKHNTISYCLLTDLGAGGVKLGEMHVRTADAERSGSNQVSDSTIADCGLRYPSAVGIWLGQTGQNLLSHNDIHGLWYSGISIGWTWGYGNALGQNNVVEFNHVHHIGTPADGVEPILSDMGGIYTLGNQAGTVIRNNCFHDIAGLRYGGWGIYFDEGTTDILAENNLVYRTTHGGFHQHYGANNVVRNNIFAFGRDMQIQRTRLEDHRSFTFEKNIVYWDHGTLLTGNWSKLNVVFDYNTYWHVGGEDFKFAHYTWEQWRKLGMDEHSRIAQPGFVDPEGADFKLKPGAEGQLAGFVPFDMTSFGPRADNASSGTK